MQCNNVCRMNAMHMQFCTTCPGRSLTPRLGDHDPWGTREVHVPLAPEYNLGSRAHSHDPGKDLGHRTLHRSRQETSGNKHSSLFYPLRQRPRRLHSLTYHH